MTVTVEELSPHQGKKLTVKLAGQEPTEYVLQGALPQGVVLYQPKVGPNLVQISDIESFEVPVVAPKEPKVKVLKDVTEETISKHLLDAHGATIDYVMQTPVADQLTFHTDLHEKYRLGHTHGTKDKTPTDAEKAAAEACTESQAGEATSEGTNAAE